MARNDFRKHPVLEFLNNLWRLASVADPWHFGVDLDPDLDPRIHASDKWIRIWIRGSIPLTNGSGSGSADPCLWQMDPDADPDPAIFVTDHQDSNKKTNIFLRVFLLLTFWRYIYIIFKDKKSKRSHKAVGIKVFITTVLLFGDKRIRIHTFE